jgi:uncharacterized membrane protein YeiH
LSRFPNIHTAGGILRGLDWIGTITFAVTGSVTAAQSGLDVFGCSMVAMVTAVGGGTIRDAILLARRPFWTSETEYIWMTVLTGMMTFFAWPYVLEWQEERQQQQQHHHHHGREKQQEAELVLQGKDDHQANQDDSDGTTTTTLQYFDELDMILETLDAIGLAAFAIIGAQNGVRAGMPMVVSAICGMSTSTFGGMLRDILCARPVRIVHSNAEVYAPPALLGAMTYLAAQKVVFPTTSTTTPPAFRIGSALMVCMASRYVAVTHNVKLHTWDTQQDGLGVAVRK